MFQVISDLQSFEYKCPNNKPQQTITNNIYINNIGYTVEYYHTPKKILNGLDNSFSMYTLSRGILRKE